jgi:hypothetical protein
MQEVIDTLNFRFGIIAYPYYVVSEGLHRNVDDTGESDASRDVRFLGESDLEQLAKIRTRPISEAKLRGLLSHCKCLGIFVDGRLAGCTWSRDDMIPTPIFLQPLKPLENDEAYLFDAFVARDFRGHRLMHFLRNRLYQELVKTGKTRFYSVTLAFNRSSRRFKQKLGAREIDLRIVVGFSRWGGFDMRLKRLHSEARAPQFRKLHMGVRTSN